MGDRLAALRVSKPKPRPTAHTTAGLTPHIISLTDVLALFIRLSSKEEMGAIPSNLARKEHMD